jgi:colicin import membrane protein
MSTEGFKVDANALALAGGAPSLRPRDADAWGPGMVLALVAHALLVAALAWGVNWHTHQEEALEAEVWSAIPEAEAPAPVVAPPVTAVAPPPAVKPPEPEAEQPLPDLVIAKKKPAKEPPKPKPREVETFDATPVKPRKADPTMPPPDLKALKLKEATDAKEAKDKEARLAKEAAAKAQAAKDKAEKDKLAKEQADQAAVEAQRQKILRDIVSRAGGGAGSNAAGQGTRNAGPSQGYIGRLKALFKRNITFSLDDVPSNPETVVDVSMAPDGTIISRNIVTRSGLPAWDEAVLRAIDRTEVLPRDETGKVPPRLTLSFRPKDY